MKKSKNFFYLLILFLLCCLYSVHSFQIKHGKIYDDKWREVYFHGMNIAVKVPPYVPKTDAYDQKMSFVKEDIDKLKDGGFNAIRLGIMWSGVEPTQGSYNETYLKEIGKIIKTAGDAGIYTILEFHQKVLSQAFCGIGLPPWLIQKDNRYRTFPFPIQRQKYPLGDNMTPDKAHCQRHCTSKYFYSYDCGSGFDELYKVDSFLNQKFTKFWQKVAEYFKGCQYIIAYDLINEPWVGNQIRNPTLLIPGIAQKLKLQKFYDRLAESVRSVDDKTPICFQPTIVDRMVGTGYYHAPGGQHFNDKSILCYSYGRQNSKSIGFKVLDAHRLKVPSLISQMYSGGKCLDRAENYYQSWFYWYYKDFGIDRKVHQQEALENEEKVQIYNSEPELCASGEVCKCLVRTYLQKVAGELVYSDFCTESSRFIASYTACPGGETILYMNKELSYGNKYSIEASPKDRVQIIESTDAESKNYVTLKFTGKQKQEVVLNVIKQQ